MSELRWTRTRPTQPGGYWVKTLSDGELELARVVVQDDYVLAFFGSGPPWLVRDYKHLERGELSDCEGWLWAGPFLPPHAEEVEP